MPDSYKVIDSKKYMWDGTVYETEDKAKEIKGQYEADGFETQLLEEEEQFLVYSRRVVTDVVVEGAP